MSMDRCKHWAVHEYSSWFTLNSNNQRPPPPPHPLPLTLPRRNAPPPIAMAYIWWRINGRRRRLVQISVSVVVSCLKHGCDHSQRLKSGHLDALLHWIHDQRLLVSSSSRALHTLFTLSPLGKTSRHKVKFDSWICLGPRFRLLAAHHHHYTTIAHHQQHCWAHPHSACLVGEEFIQLYIKGTITLGMELHFVLFISARFSSNSFPSIK